MPCVTLDNHINILNIIEQDDTLQQLTQFKLDKQHLHENFIKDMTILHDNYKTKIAFLELTMTKVSFKWIHRFIDNYFIIDLFLL